MVVLVVSFFGDGPRPKLVCGLLPMGFAKSPTAVNVGSERGMDCYDSF